MGHGRTCKSSSTNCPDFTGKSERAAWIFPRSPKETTPGEKERPSGLGRAAARQEPAGVLCLPGSMRASGASGRGWESLVLAQPSPQHQRRKNPSSFPQVLNLPGFKGSHESRCPGAAWCISHHMGNVWGTWGTRLLAMKQQLDLCGIQSEQSWGGKPAGSVGLQTRGPTRATSVGSSLGLAPVRKTTMNTSES